MKQSYSASLTTFFHFSSYKLYGGSLKDVGIQERKRIFTLNPHTFYLAERDDLLRNALNETELLLPDGIGIVWASRLLHGIRIKRIPGMEAFEHLLALAAEEVDEKKRNVFFLGATSEILERIRQRIRREYPTIKAGFYSPPFVDEFTEQQTHAMLKAINQFEPHILFVGMTAPKQEKWVHQNRHAIMAPVSACIGVAFDYYAGTLQRPGKFWQDIGLEWFIRLLGEPVRLWRRSFVSAPMFLLRVIQLKWRA